MKELGVVYKPCTSHRIVPLCHFFFQRRLKSWCARVLEKRARGRAREEELEISSKIIDSEVRELDYIIPGGLERGGCRFLRTQTLPTRFLWGFWEILFPDDFDPLISRWFMKHKSRVWGISLILGFVDGI